MHAGPLVDIDAIASALIIRKRFWPGHELAGHAATTAAPPDAVLNGIDRDACEIGEEIAE